MHRFGPCCRLFWCARAPTSALSCVEGCARRASCAILDFEDVLPNAKDTVHIECDMGLRVSRVSLAELKLTVDSFDEQFKRAIDSEPPAVVPKTETQLQVEVRERVKAMCEADDAPWPDSHLLVGPILVRGDMTIDMAQHVRAGVRPHLILGVRSERDTEVTCVWGRESVFSRFQQAGRWVPIFPGDSGILHGAAHVVAMYEVPTFSAQEGGLELMMAHIASFQVTNRLTHPVRTGAFLQKSGVFGRTKSLGEPKGA